MTFFNNIQSFALKALSLVIPLFIQLLHKLIYIFF